VRREAGGAEKVIRVIEVIKVTWIFRTAGDGVT